MDDTGMKVGDLVRERPDSIMATTFNADPCESLGIILAVEGGVATVAWFYHKIFGAHECYSTREELIILNKNT